MPSRYTHGKSELADDAVVQASVREELVRLGTRLRALRDNRDLTQESAAERIQIHEKHLQKIESGHANVTFAVLVSASIAYDVPLTALFKPVKPRMPKRKKKLPPKPKLPKRKKKLPPKPKMPPRTN